MFKLVLGNERALGRKALQLVGRTSSGPPTPRRVCSAARAVLRSPTMGTPLTEWAAALSEEPRLAIVVISSEKNVGGGTAVLRLEVAFPKRTR